MNLMMRTLLLFSLVTTFEACDKNEEVVEAELAEKSDACSQELVLSKDKGSSLTDNEGALILGETMVQELHAELAVTYPAETAVAIAEAAKQEMVTIVGSLVIEDGGSLSNLEAVAQPVMTGALLGSASKCAGLDSSESRTAAIADIVPAVIATLNGKMSEMTESASLKLIGEVAGAAVKTLPESTYLPEDANETVAVVSHAGVKSLPRAGIAESSLVAATKEVVSYSVAALDTEGFNSEAVSTIAANVAGTAIKGLNEAGLSSQKMVEGNAIGNIMSSAAKKLKDTKVGAPGALGFLQLAAAKSISVLKEAGFDSAEVRNSAISNIVGSLIGEAKDLSDGNTEVLASTMSSIANSSVSAISDTDIAGDEVNDVVSVIVETGVKKIAELGVKDAKDAIDLAAKLVKSTMEGIAGLYNKGIIDKSQVGASQNATKQSASAGLDTLKESGTIPESAVDDFNDSVSQSISSGLESADAGTLAAPSFSIAAGTYTSVQTLVLESSVEGAAVRYTMDGSTPSETVGTVYSQAIAINSSITIKAIAYKEGSISSQIVSAKYVINLPEQIADPTFSPGAGTFSSAQSVTISTTSAGASIRYTIDGSAPSDISGTVYAGAITVNATTTIKALAYKQGALSSGEVSATYTINIPEPETVAQPTFSVAAGTYSNTLSVTLQSSTEGASIRYTLDNSEPTSSTGTVYSGAIAITSSKTLKAIAYKEGWTTSAVSSAAYTLNIPIFASAVFTTTGDNPEGVAIGDLNKDGHADLAVALYAGKGVSFLLGNGDGTFSAKQDIINLVNNTQSALIAIGDLSADGKADITWGAWGANILSILTNSTADNANTLSFANGNVPWTTDVGHSGPRTVAISDIDLDGDVDIVVGETNGYRLIVYQNSDGTPGTFTKYGTQWNFNNNSYTGHTHPGLIGIADFNGDNKPDVVGTGQFTGRFSVLLNNTTSNGTPDFQASNGIDTNADMGCTLNRQHSIADFNGDGKKDIVAICPTAGTDKIVFFTNSTATNATSASFTTSSMDTTEGISGVAAGDIDGDGDADMVFITDNGGVNTLYYYPGNGDGTFGTVQSFSIGSSTTPYMVALADIDGDNRLDAVVTHNGTDQISVLINQTPD